MNLNEIFSSLPGEFGKEIIASVIVALTFACCGLAFKGIRSFFSSERQKPDEYRRYSAPLSDAEIFEQDYYQDPYPKRKVAVQPQNNNQAWWAAGLAFGSYVCWVTVPLLALPMLLISLWLGFSTRRQTAGKVAIFTSCFHIVLLSCGIILIIVLVLLDNGYYYPY
jgi:hypothetical protein